MATEKKKMYMTYSLETDPSICDVIAYVDNGKVMCYYDVGCPRDIEIPKSCQHFFDSEEEARKYIIERIDYLRKKAKEVKEWIDEVGSYWLFYDCEHAVSLNDAITWCSANSILGKDENERTINALAKCVRTQSVVIDGTTIPISSISHIEWGNNPTIVIIGGQRVVAKDYYEKHLLELIFDGK